MASSSATLPLPATTLSGTAQSSFISSVVSSYVSEASSNTEVGPASTGAGSSETATAEPTSTNQSQLPTGNGNGSSTVGAASATSTGPSPAASTAAPTKNAAVYRMPADAACGGLAAVIAAVLIM